MRRIRTMGSSASAAAAALEEEDPSRASPRRGTYAAAGVVTVLAVTVISMVIRAVLRSEDIRLSVNNGYVAADILWTTTPSSPSTKTTTATAAATDDESSATQPDTAITQQLLHQGVITPDDVGSDYYGEGMTTRSRSRGCYLGCSGGSGSITSFYNPPPAPPATQVTMHAANTKNLRVILIVNNPGGRARVDCNLTDVTITDPGRRSRPYPIASFRLDNFTVPPQTTITLQKRVEITDEAVLGYIWERHRGRSAFGVVLRVASSVASYPLGKMTEPKALSYACRSVTLGLVEDETSLATNQGDCS